MKICGNMKKDYIKPCVTVLELGAGTQILRTSGEYDLPDGYEGIGFSDEECDDPA